MSKEKTNLNVEGMTCNHCVMSIKKAVGELKGVDQVDLSLENKKVTVEYNPEQVNLVAIKEAIEDQGYEVK